MRKLDPPPWRESGQNEYLMVRAWVSTSTGWLDLNNHNGFEIDGDSLGNRQVTHRRQEVSSPYLPGSWVVNSVPEMVTETVGVWVRGSSHAEMYFRLAALQDAFTQPTFFMSWQVEDHQETWVCNLSDYSINTQREFLHSRTARFVAQVPRYPYAPQEQVIPSESLQPQQF